MSYGHGRFWITFNGEIYNFLELREELRKLGHQFKSETDSEVILAAYSEWGTQCQYKFNGMWAFAIWDTEDHVLFLSRDRFGVKPLFYLYDGNRFIFASELKAFMSLTEELRPAFDDGMIAWMVNIEVAENTVLRNVKNLPAGHCLNLRLQRNYSPSITAWWNTLDHLVEVPRNLEEQVDGFRELFFDACRLRMRSDVPIATALSGGLDSSSVLCAIHKIGTDGGKLGSSNTQERITDDYQKAFVLDYQGTSHSERHYAEEVCAHTGVDARIVELNPAALSPDDLTSAIFSNEAIQSREPFLGPWSLYREMRLNSSVVSMDGHGGDELLAGYVPYPSVAMRDALWPWSRARWNDLQATLFAINSEDLEIGRDTSLPTRGSILRGQLQARYQAWKQSVAPTMVNFTRQNFPGVYQGARSIYRNARGIDTNNSNEHRSMGRHLLINPTDPGFQNRLFSNEKISFSSTNLDHLGRRLHFDFHRGSLPVILRNFDRVSMAHGIEIRAPFLDWRLVCYVFSLPSTTKIRNGFTKWALRDAMRGVLPESIRTRPGKLGFSSPMYEWIGGSLREYIFDVVTSNDFLTSTIWNGPDIRDEIELAYQNSDVFAVSKNWKFIQAAILIRTFRDNIPAR